MTRTLLIFLLLLSSGHAANAPERSSQDAPALPHSVTVQAVGTTNAQPTFLEQSTMVKSHGETGDESAVAFGQARLRAERGLLDAGVEGLEVLGHGVRVLHGEAPAETTTGGVRLVRAVQIGVAFDAVGSTSEASDPGVTCTEALAVRFPAAQGPEAQMAEAARVLDLLMDLGLSARAPQPLPNETPSAASLRGVLAPAARADAERAAQAAAMQRARELAAGLARLSGRSLGPVNSIHQVSLTSTWRGLGAGIEMSCALSVTFELE